ncbi:hypothetical protein JY651_27860 [Pyxidicoccus parkwayensis]|uniref:Lipoprotein n=1 Tax=Pyxidicoccus parkwayensis TaxID=2813578 RepID=A0ABX7NL48_9BACT|nr:hypothetical protein [Pyxidicoccus parkwaysis]QSQ19161.1 hypothetical protein JY651_27860 [Pyxidicoccus parkwaysis]
MHRGLLLTCVALSLLVPPLTAHAQTAPEGYALELEEQYTPWNIQDLEMQGYSHCLGQCQGWTRVFTFQFGFEDAATVEMAARAIEALPGFNPNLVRTGTLTYEQFGTKVYYPFQPLADAYLNTWWDGEEEVSVAFYQRNFLPRYRQSFVILFAHSGTVLFYEQADFE